MINKDTGVIEDTTTGGISVAEVSNKIGIGSLDVATLCRGGYTPETDTAKLKHTSTNINLFSAHKPIEYNSYQKLEDFEYVKSTYGINMCSDEYLKDFRNTKIISSDGSEIPIYTVGGKDADEIFYKATAGSNTKLGYDFRNRYDSSEKYSSWDVKVWNLPMTKYRILDFDGYDSNAPFPYAFEFENPGQYDGFKIESMQWPNVECKGIVSTAKVKLKIKNVSNSNSISFSNIFNQADQKLTYKFGVVHRDSQTIKDKSSDISLSDYTPDSAAIKNPGDSISFSFDVSPGFMYCVPCLYNGNLAIENAGIAKYIYLHKGYFKTHYTRVKKIINTKFDVVDNTGMPVWKNPFMISISGNNVAINPQVNISFLIKDETYFDPDDTYQLPSNSDLLAKGMLYYEISLYTNKNANPTDTPIAKCTYPTQSAMKSIYKGSGSDKEKAALGLVSYPINFSDAQKNNIFSVNDNKSINLTGNDVEWLTGTHDTNTLKTVQAAYITLKIIDVDGLFNKQDNAWDYIGKIQIENGLSLTWKATTDSRF